MDIRLFFGAKINVSTEGEDVGHGAIVLLGCSALW